MADPTTPPTTTMKKSELKALLAQANISDPAAVIAAVSSAAPTGDSAAAQAPLTMKKSELLAALEGEVQLLALLQIAKAGALDGRDVNEDVLRSVARLDESEAALGVEELNGTDSHDGLLYK